MVPETARAMVASFPHRGGSVSVTHEMPAFYHLTSRQSRQDVFTCGNFHVPDVHEGIPTRIRRGVDVPAAALPRFLDPDRRDSPV